VGGGPVLSLPFPRIFEKFDEMTPLPLSLSLSLSLSLLAERKERESVEEGMAMRAFDARNTLLITPEVRWCR